MDYPLINGHRYSWASMDFDFDGLEIEFIQEFTYNHSLEPGDVRGAGAQKQGRTRGDYNAEGSITMHQEGWDIFRNHLGNGFMEKSWTAIVNYADDGQPVTTDEVVGCRITNVEKGGSQGTDGNTVTLSLNILYIIEDGVEPLHKMRK